MVTEVLLTNVHSYRNAGDAALTYVTVEQLREQFPHSHITLAMDDPDSHSGEGEAIESFFSLVRRRNKWHIGNLLLLIPASIVPIITYRLFSKPVLAFTPRRWQPLLRAYVRSHMVVSKPGGFLYTSGRGLTLLISIYTLALALFAGKPVYIFPQSIGPLSRRWERILLKHVLRQVRIVMVREPNSLHQLQTWGLSSRSCYLLPDLAFTYPSAPASSAKEWLQRHGIDLDRGSPLLGMTVINWEAQNPHFKLQARYETACAETARFFAERYGGKVVLFPQVWGPSPSQDDRVPTCRIADQLSDLRSSLLMVEEPIPSDLLKSVYGLMSLFIGTRMHSNIFALSQGVPVIAIGYQPKTRGILQMLELDQWAIDIRQVTEQRLTKMLRELWEEQEAVRVHLDDIVPTLVQQASQAGAMIAADFSALEEASEYD